MVSLIINKLKFSCYNKVFQSTISYGKGHKCRPFVCFRTKILHYFLLPPFVSPYQSVHSEFVCDFYLQPCAKLIQLQLRHQRGHQNIIKQDWETDGTQSEQSLMVDRHLKQKPTLWNTRRGSQENWSFLLLQSALQNSSMPNRDSSPRLRSPISINIWGWNYTSWLSCPLRPFFSGLISVNTLK